MQTTEETKIECYQCEKEKPAKEIFYFCPECVSEIEPTYEEECPFCDREAKLLCQSCDDEMHGDHYQGEYEKCT